MSVSAVASCAFYNPQSLQTTFRKFRAGVQQLGQDLESRNLSAVRSDFASLKNLGRRVRPRHRRATVPSPKLSTDWPRIFSPAPFPAPSRTLRRSSRISKTNPRRARLRHRSHTIMAADPVRSVHCSTSSAPRCRRALSPLRDRQTLRRPSSPSHRCRAAECKRSLRRCLVRTALRPLP